MTQSFIFDFQRTPLFFDKWNIDFKLLEMNTSNNFEIVYSEFAPNNIEDCLNANGGLNSNVELTSVVPCSLKWENDIISVRNDVRWNIGENNYQLKALFVRNKVSGFVMGYSIHMNSFNVTNEVVLESGTILWSIQDD